MGWAKTQDQEAAMELAKEEQLHFIIAEASEAISDTLRGMTTLVQSFKTGDIDSDTRISEYTELAVSETRIAGSFLLSLDKEHARYDHWGDGVK